MPSKPHVPNFSPLGFMGLVHESRLECFLTFLASICWSLVSAPLPLEVQSWGRWWSPFILLTSADMIALGHYSCQAEGGRKLMGQPLVPSQRLGSLVWVPSCSFWLGMNKDCLPTLLCLLLVFFAWACSHGLGCVHILPWAFIPHGLLLVNILGFFINTCNGSLGN